MSRRPWATWQTMRRWCAAILCASCSRGCDDPVPQQPRMPWGGREVVGRYTSVCSRPQAHYCRRFCTRFWEVTHSGKQIEANMVPVVQLVRASDCGSECRGFESHRVPNSRKFLKPKRFWEFTFLEFYVLVEHNWTFSRYFINDSTQTSAKSYKTS